MSIEDVRDTRGQASIAFTSTVKAAQKLVRQLEDYYMALARLEKSPDWDRKIEEANTLKGLSRDMWRRIERIAP